MTGLPIIWGEGEIGETLSGARKPMAAFRWLERHYALSVLDRIGADTLNGQRVLLLAQPRAFAPEELVALDRWMRAGGRALILTDPSLRWPSIYPPGDPRAPPAVSLLDPLLDHWGLRLDLTQFDMHAAAEPVTLTSAGRNWRITVAAPGRFVATGKDCLVEAKGLMARCAVGRGHAVLIADADLMADALWMGDGNTENRASDNMALLGALLDQLSGISRDGLHEPAVPEGGAEAKFRGGSGVAVARIISLILAISVVLFIRRRGV